MSDSDPNLLRNLLFAILAEVNGIISRDNLLDAVKAWTEERDREIPAILMELGAMSAEECEQLEPMVARHILRHQNDPAKSLATLSGISSAAAQLADIDATVAQSLDMVSAGSGSGFTGSSGTSTLSQGTIEQADFTNARFHIVRPEVNGGGLGVISIARDNDVRREVVVKQIRRDRSDSEGARAQFLLEAEITGLLEHPGIVPVYGLGYDKHGRPFYAMRLIRGVVDSEKQDELAEQEEYETLATVPLSSESGRKDKGRGSRRPPKAEPLTAGKTLHDAIKEYHEESDKTDTLSLQQLLRRFIDVCDAVHYAHTRDVLHRDLKPKNIMLGQHGETLVIDWGLACIQETRTPSEDSLKGTLTDPTVGSGSGVGTPGFMSPEQAQGLPLDVRTDVYSLGATLYTLLCGRSAFSLADVRTHKDYISARPEEQFQVALRLLGERIAAGKFTLPTESNPETPQALEQVCLKAMAVSPNERYNTVKALRREIERWLDDEPVLAWTEPWSAKLARQLRKRPRLVTGTVAALVVGLLTASAAAVMINAEKRNVERQRTLAQRYFNAANDAVSEFFTRVSQEKLLDVAGMQPLRDDLLQSAVTFFQELAGDEAPNDSEYRQERALAHFYLGRVRERLGETDSARKSYGKAIELQQAIIADNPDDVDAHRSLGTTQNAMGRLAQDKLDDLPGAKKSYEEAFATREHIVKLPGAVGEDHRLLASSYMNRGQLVLRAALAAGSPRDGAASEDENEAIQLARTKSQDLLGLAAEANSKAIAMADDNPEALFRGHRDRLMILYNRANSELHEPRGLTSSMNTLNSLLRESSKLRKVHRDKQELLLISAKAHQLLSEVFAKFERGEQSLWALQHLQAAFDLLSELAHQNPFEEEYAELLANLAERIASDFEATGDLGDGEQLDDAMWYRVHSSIGRDASVLIDHLAHIFRAFDWNARTVVANELAHNGPRRKPETFFLRAYVKRFRSLELDRENQRALAVGVATEALKEIDEAILAHAQLRFSKQSDQGRAKLEPTLTLLRSGKIDEAIATNREIAPVAYIELHRECAETLQRLEKRSQAATPDTAG